MIIFANFPPEKTKIILNLLIKNIGIELFLIFLIFVAYKTKRLTINFLIFIIAIELFIFARGNLFFAPISVFTQQLTLPNTGIDRVISTADTAAYTGPHVYWNHLRVRQPFAPDLSDQELKEFQRLQKEINNIPSNLNINYGLYNSSGYSAVVLESYAKYWESNLVNSVAIKDLSDPRLSYLGVNYIFTGYPDDYARNLDGFVKSENLNPTVYQRSEKSFRIHLERNRGEAQIVSYKPSEVVINTNTITPDILVLTDSAYPGWEGYLDGEKIELLSYKNTFRAVAVPSGEHQVVIKYSPNSVKIGGILSLIGLLISLFLLTLNTPLKVVK